MTVFKRDGRFIIKGSPWRLDELVRKRDVDPRDLWYFLRKQVHLECGKRRQLLAEVEELHNQFRFEKEIMRNCIVE